MYKLSKLIKERLSGSLPSNMEVNPKESLKALTLRSGKQLPSPVLEKSIVEPNEPQLEARQSGIIDLETTTDIEKK